MIKYIGSKRVLVPHIVAAVQALPEVRRVLDLFSGTSRVGHGLKRAGFEVHANDHLAYAATLARCYVQADATTVRDAAASLIGELNTTEGRPGYFTQTFCEQARYFQPKNGAKVDAIRDQIAQRGLDPVLEAVALVSLMEAADRVDSTTGVQMAYLKQWARRAHNDLQMRLPAILEGPGLATQLDAVEAAACADADVAYLDPPYNQHSYMGNYHVWETLVRWDEPEPYGVAQKRLQCREYKSDFNSKRRIHQALRDCIHALRTPHLLVSFNNEGHVRCEEMLELLSERGGHVGYVEFDFKRYVGAQIGIHNPQGERVGEVSHLRNKEYLFVASHERGRVERVLKAVQRSMEQERRRKPGVASSAVASHS